MEEESSTNTLEDFWQDGNTDPERYKRIRLDAHCLAIEKTLRTMDIADEYKIRADMMEEMKKSQDDILSSALAVVNDALLDLQEKSGFHVMKKNMKLQEPELTPDLLNILIFYRSRLSSCQ